MKSVGENDLVTPGKIKVSEWYKMVEVNGVYKQAGMKKFDWPVCM